MSDDSTSERAKELLVYGPLGLALFLRDSGPQFLRMFVARGRTEVEQRRRAVGEQLDQVRSVGETAATDGGPEVLRILSTGLTALREKAEAALQALGATSESTPDAPERDDAGAGTSVAWTPSDTRQEQVTLAIVDYDDLAASQIVERLDGLSRSDLEIIRDHEAAHRARHTILGKIEQLTRG